MIHSCVIIAIHANQYISTSKIVEIISESTYAMVYACWIPTFLELNPVGLYFLLIQQIFYVYCQLVNCHSFHIDAIFSTFNYCFRVSIRNPELIVNG